MAACSNNRPENAAAKATSEAGILVAADSIRIDDPLNELYFSVRLETTEQTDSGRYKVIAAWGYNEGQTDLVLPEGLENASPDVRRDSGYAFVVGFRTKEDTSFHDYFRITSNQGNLEMKYLKAYYFQ